MVLNSNWRTVGYGTECPSISLHNYRSNNITHGRQIGTRRKEGLVVGASRDKSSGMGTEDGMSMGYHLLVLGACVVLCFLYMYIIISSSIDVLYNKCSRCIEG